jgi:hypothetical protein
MATDGTSFDELAGPRLRVLGVLLDFPGDRAGAARHHLNARRARVLPLRAVRRMPRGGGFQGPRSA